MHRFLERHLAIFSFKKIEWPSRKEGARGRRAKRLEEPGATPQRAKRAKRAKRAEPAWLAATTNEARRPPERASD